MEIEANMPAGAYRMKVYEAIQNVIGRKLTDNEHKYLSNLLKGYVLAHAPTKPIKQAPIVHEWTCTSCFTIRKTVGTDQNKKVIRQIKSQNKILKKESQSTE